VPIRKGDVGKGNVHFLICFDRRSYLKYCNYQ
jgi:hypothetical protein